MALFLKGGFILASIIGVSQAQSDICNCVECCNVDEDSSIHFTGKTIVEFTYPTTSFDGTYTIVGHHYDDGARRLAAALDTTPYQYVVKYENSFKDAFDRNVIIFSSNEGALNCDDSHLYYGNPDDTYYKKIDMVLDGDHCTLDIDGKLTRDEISYTDKIFFAFDKLVDEGDEFHIMYDNTEPGIIIPLTDTIEYPYVIYDGTVTATDSMAAGELYVDVSLDVNDIGVTDISEFNTTGCLTPDEMFLNEAVWVTAAGGTCPVTLIGTEGTGDATVAPGRNYHLKIPQFEYQSCAAAPVELVGDDLVFTFRLELPRSHEDTETGEGDGCYYFSENENVQNITITMAQDVTSTIDTAFISNFNTRVASVTPDRETKCIDESMYPTPHAQIKFTIEATFPGTYGSDFPESGITLPTLEGLTVEWDTITGDIPNVIPCTNFAGEAGVEDDYQVCEFNLRTVVCEPIYPTDDGQCAFERDNARLLTGFVVTEEMPGGQLATYPAGDMNLGIDNSKFAPEFCAADEEDAAVNVNDVFDISLDLQNYYETQLVDWDVTDNITMSKDMIARLSVGQRQDSPFNFDDDLELMITVVTVELSNPVTNDIITSYTWSKNDKLDFMDYSWTPYYSDPRFCTWYAKDSADKCEPFFVDGVRSNNYHDADWITNTMPDECQVTNSDTNNHDYFLFNPREWFADNTKGLVDMKIIVTGVIHKCSDNGARRLDEVRTNARKTQATPSPDVDILYITDELVISFVTNEDGSTDLDIASVTPTGWLEENITLVSITAILGTSIFVGAILMSKKKHYGALTSSYSDPPF